ncbi:unnamed protein product [Cylicocyclus nassatus]|uniref:HAT C-terminal dimerisation domain-containing protein n=1 Tax=Cylicocyclus nassatus TaxID=53992 RepID=A0AA36H261_CYLNA|nr:unnamed protein product [Cylicocyclus nassatus]
MGGWVNEPGLSKSLKQHAMQKMLALSSDGAAVMSGHVHGVFAKLKDMIAEETEADLYPRNNLLISVCMTYRDFTARVPMGYVNDEIERIDTDFLDNYPNQDDRRLLAYKPRAFAEFTLDRYSQSEGDHEERERLLDWHLFRNLARTTSYEESPPDLDNPEVTFSLEDAPESSEVDLRHHSLAKRYEDFDWNNAVYPCIICFYNEMKQALDAQFVNKPHEFNNIDLLALDNIIHDIIEFNGDFENGFVDYVQTQTSSTEDARAILLWELTHLIQIFVNSKFWIPLKYLFVVYRTLLQYNKELHVPDEVQQAIKCVLILPASNADPQRSFSAANRLTREERSTIKRESLDNIMTVQRNGPSILTVELQQLALQWMHPAPGLGLDPGMPSNLAREGSLMKAVKENLAKGVAYELAKLHVRRHMMVHRPNARKDTEEIKKRLL